ncbi:hypothetical protein WJX73_003414 [Symbiochloris irregularis]|uniref:ditrans,polycis-polyprenyl diphosphate synthase [(2E,6E)-farnesyldiphosphate specific] n=1 Tax=Symbiochloris irregularis TaxID=706552 RepID=A0AAW1NUU2_9CHLO
MGPTPAELAHRLLLPILYKVVCAQLAIFTIWQGFLERLGGFFGFFLGFLLLSRADTRVGHRKRIKRGLQAHSVGVVVHELDVTRYGLDDLTYLLLWCFEAGAGNVFLYEPSGGLKQADDKLLRRLRAYSDGTQSFSISTQTEGGCRKVRRCSRCVTWPEAADIHDLKRVTSKCGVTLLSLSDSFVPLRDSYLPSKGLGEGHDDSAPGSTGFTQGLDPDFMLVIGGDSGSSCLSTAGYPPWATRFCEIYGLGPMQAVTAASIDAAFRTYSRTTQNFGV